MVKWEKIRLPNEKQDILRRSIHVLCGPSDGIQKNGLPSVQLDEIPVRAVLLPRLDKWWCRTFEEMSDGLRQ